MTDVNKLRALASMSKEAILSNVAYFNQKEVEIGRELKKARDNTLLNLKALRYKAELDALPKKL
jgi:hypothetical protein